ncbi:MAG: CapA family protein [Bacteroidetes bacterium]|nr:CapA family protein [Bacteroidota bacterium]MBU1719952.1 CapA family protein [Bacteroidota bacterium]
MKLSFFGDISLHKINHEEFTFCNSFYDLVKTSNLVIGNLECPITEISIKEENQAICMSASVSSLDLLNSFHVVSLANNHIRDFQVRGLQDTVEAIDSTGIYHFGVGKTQKQAIEPLLIEKDGFKIAFFGATRYANATEENGGGTANDSFSLMKNHIRKLKKEGYFVIPYFHWGYEFVRIPSPKERKLAHKCIEAGADIIIGSHPHIYQGIEEYKGKKIVYSLGNFIFHSSVFDGFAPIDNDSRLNESFAFSIEINQDFSYQTEIHGYNTNDRGVVFYNEQENNKLKLEIDDISAILKAPKFKYLKAYYYQTHQISKLNVKVRKKYLNIKKQSLSNKIKIYRTATTQDLKNRLAGLIISLFKK